MRRLVSLFLCFCFFLCGCTGYNIKEVQYNKNANYASTGVWLSFSEINGLLNGKENFHEKIDEVIKNCVSLKIENVYIHVRSYCDSLFKSEYFPIIDEVKEYEFDVFEYMLNEFHDAGIKVHAWINPYRVLTSSADINALSQKSPAYVWLNDETKENDINVCFYKGIYLNPAEAQVRALVINGIREIIEKYNVDGIHFDDYFYPTTDEEFDKDSYMKYLSNTENPLSLENWRRFNVNALISGCYTAIKYLNKDIVFSVSPAASIENNYNNLYADVKHWVKEGYIDSIIPQLYFGFNYPQKEFRFENLLKTWCDIASLNRNVELIIGLGSYKIGTELVPDYEEWQNSNDIIARQAKICYEDATVKGFVFFSYNSLFSQENFNTAQRENYKNTFKNLEE